jgi:FtsH-binding integral membrane protein
LQYVALVGFVVAEAIILVPLLAIAITRYVAAALQLFASVALMFWYVLRLFMSRD